MAVCRRVFRHKVRHLFELDWRYPALTEHSPNCEVSKRVTSFESLLDRLSGNSFAEQLRDHVGRPAQKEETEGKLVWIRLKTLKKRFATLLANAGRACEEFSKECTEASLYPLQA